MHPFTGASQVCGDSHSIIHNISVELQTYYIKILYIYSETPSKCFWKNSQQIRLINKENFLWGSAYICLGTSHCYSRAPEPAY